MITLIDAVMTCLAIVVMTQFVLLMVSVEVFVGGDRQVRPPRPWLRAGVSRRGLAALTFRSR